MNGDGRPESLSGQAGGGLALGGRYRLISQVGAGGMAVVWQAHDHVLGRTVAVKVLASHYADDHQSREGIRREAQATAALSHPNIAQVYDYGEADLDGEIIPYVVMELIRGVTLQQRLNTGQVPPRYAMRICAEIAAALAAAHAEGLAHRDIKPANVMLAPTGAKVVDFGIAAAIRPRQSGADDFEVFGTPAYLAPERLLHDAVEPASDVYALGVLLYRLLSGHSPWTSETTTQMLTAHVYFEPAPLMPTHQVPPYVIELCNRCLAKDPAERPSAREAAALLAHGAGLLVITDEPPAADPTAVDPEPSVLIRESATTGLKSAGRSGSRPAAPPPVAAPGPPTANRRRRAVYAGAASTLLVAVSATLWLLRPEAGQDSAPIVHLTGTSATSQAPPRGSPSPQQVRRSTPVTRPVTAPTAGPTRSAAIPANPVPTRPATVSTTAVPDPTVTRTTVAPAEPVERTLSSVAGTVRATCPAAGTARILSWSATKPYKVTQGTTEAGPSPSVSFRHGSRELTMTVTCDGGVPAATSA